MKKIEFILSNYFQLFIFACSCFGMGIWVLRRAIDLVKFDALFSTALTISVGIGVHIVVLQLLGFLGFLTKANLIGLISIGIFGLISHYLFSPAKLAATGKNFSAEPIQPKTHWFFYSILIVLFFELFLRPLHPPTAWDEVMYHLPHAKEWALNEKITVNQWLRYPLFPFNFNLLYAESILFDNDVLPHLLHAFSGLLITIGIHRIGKKYFDGVIANLSVFLFVILALGQFSNAYVDLGLSLFIFYGFVCVFLWFEGKDEHLIFIGTFLIGVAAGIKYQGLMFAPLLAIIVLLKERRLSRLALLTVFFLIPCFFWYLRSYLVSGNPVHPLAGQLFGYWQWNEQDMQLQLADIKRVADWPNWAIWPSVGALFFRSKFSYPPFRAAILISLYTFILWLVTSHYSRYLLPVYPFMALLTAVVIRELFLGLRKRIYGDNAKNPSKRSEIVKNSLSIFILTVLFVALVPSVKKHWEEIQTTNEERDSFLRKEIPSYEIAEFLKQHPEYRLVQFGLESDMYYLPRGTIGDVFGPGRYTNFRGISGQELDKRIRQFGANALLLSDSDDSRKIKNTDGFNDYFIQIKSTPKAELYSLKK
ncbi:ArnT family glycosyltransferase [Undibacterium sp. Ji49W]|uniref:ArnT family glycosyltransferase n=1 Tax=Undibacterium sp. Ji49W TaxID=3413040 RepID=UPI003BF34C52